VQTCAQAYRHTFIFSPNLNQRTTVTDTDTTNQPAVALTAVHISALPPLGAPFNGGHFAGVTTQADGTHVAVVLLPGQASDIEWANATEWAAQLGGVPPTRPIAALLFANLKAHLKPQWHWTSDEYDASYAWVCDFDRGTQIILRKSFEGSAVAVRCIPLIP